MSTKIKLGALAGAFLLLASWLFGSEEAIRLLQAVTALAGLGSGS